MPVKTHFSIGSLPGLVHAVIAAYLIAWIVHPALAAPATSPVIVKTETARGESVLSHASLCADGKHVIYQRLHEADLSLHDVRVVNAFTGTNVEDLVKKDERLLSAEVTADGRFIIVVAAKALQPETIRIKEIKTRKLVFEKPGVAGSAHLTPDGRFVVFFARGIAEWLFVDCASWTITHRVATIQEDLRDGQYDNFAFSPSNKRMAATQGEWLSVWNVTSGERRHRLPLGRRSPVRAAAFISETELRTAHEDGLIVTWDLVTHKPSEIRVKPDTMREAYALAFRESGRTLLWGTRGEIVFWNADTGESYGSFKHGPKPESFSYLQGSEGQSVLVNIDGSRESNLSVQLLPQRSELTPYVPPRR